MSVQEDAPNAYHMQFPTWFFPVVFVFLSFALSHESRTTGLRDGIIDPLNVLPFRPDLHSGLDASSLFKAAPPTPIPRLTPQKGTDGAEVALMPEKVGLFGALAPKLDGVAQGVHGLRVPADKRAPKVYVRQVVDLRLQVGDLANIVGDRVKERPRHVG